VGDRSDRDDPLRVQESVGPEVVGFDVVKVRGVLERRVLPVQLLHPPVDIRISMADIADVTFEVPDIDWIETDDSDPKPNVCLGQLIPDDGFLALEYLFDLVQGLEHWKHGSLVCFSAVCEASLVNSIVDSVVNPIINGVDFAAKFLGIDVNLGLVGRDEIVELGVEHSDDLGAFVVHDRLVLLVPKDRNGEPSGIIWLGLEIQILDVSRAVQRIDLRCRVLVGSCEGPPVLAHARGNNRNRDDFIEALELSGDQRPRRPGTSVRHVEVVAIFFWREFATLLNEIPEG